jgi:hypothetical protein
VVVVVEDCKAVTVGGKMTIGDSGCVVPVHHTNHA